MQQGLVEELRGLPDELRELLLLRSYEDLSCAEIARRRGLPASPCARGCREDQSVSKLVSSTSPGPVTVFFQAE